MSKNVLKPLSEHKPFLYILYGTAIVSISIATIIAWNEKLQLCGTSECFENFFILFSAPIKIASTGLGLAAFIGLIHRSEQNFHQTNIQISQQNFKNYIDHKNEFISILTEFENSHNIKINKKTSFYKRSFPNNSVYNTSLSIKKQDNSLITKTYSKINYLCKKIEETNKKIENIEISEKEIEKLCSEIFFESLVITSNLSISKEKSKKQRKSDLEFFGYIPQDIEENMEIIINLIFELVDFSNIDEDFYFENFCPCQKITDTYKAFIKKQNALQILTTELA